MYKIKNLILIIIAACTISLAVDYQVPFAAVAPVIDANDLAGEWDGAVSIDISYPEILAAGGSSITGTPTHTDLSGNVKMLWDADNLYVYVRVYDDNMTFTKSYPGPYNGQDCFQVAFNVLNNSSAVVLEDAAIYDFTAQTAGGTGASVYCHGVYNVSKLTVAGKQFADGWQMEIAIPWYATYHRYAYPGDRHGLGLLLVDYDGGTTLTNFLADFGGGENTISDAATWNTITLVSTDGCGPHGRFAGDLSGDCYVTLIDAAILAQQWGMDTLEQ